MKKIAQLTVLLLAVSVVSYSQHENKNWYFGNGTDGIVFDANNNPVKVNNKYYGVGEEGIVNVTDPYSGELLFYSDGIKVINKNHQLMQSGLLSNYSCSQAVQVCRVPNHCNQYYIIENSSWDDTPGSFYYSIVDFTTNPLGQVTALNQLIGGPNYHQAMRVIPKANSNNYWLIGHLYNTATYHVYEVTPTGFVGPVVYNFSNGGRSWAMEYSPVTQKLVNMGQNNLKVTIFDFNPATGVLSNEQQIGQLSFTMAGAGNFSSDGTKLYCSIAPGNVFWQYDFTTSVWTNMNTCCYAHDVKTGPDGIAYMIHTYYGANPMGKMTSQNSSAISNACGYSTITIGNFNGEVRRFPEFLITVPPPNAILDTLTVQSPSTTTINPLSNDSDPQGDPISLDSIVIGPHLGTATMSGNQIIYVADSGICSGWDTIVYKIADNNCSFDTARIIIHIVGGGSVACFSANPVNGCPPLNVTFTNTSTGGSNYLWDFGDLSTSTSANPTHTYTSIGIYTVTLIVYGLNGCNDTTHFNSISTQGPPAVTCAFTPANNLQACDSITVQFTNGSINATTYLWNFGDGNTSTATNPSHTYSISGTYTVTLVSKDSTACGLSIDSSKHINSITINQSAHAAFPDTALIGCNDLSVNFINNSTNATSYLWNFGDGNTSTYNNPNHQYTTPGTYHVSLIAYGAGGCNDTLLGIDSNTIISTNISSSFIADSVIGCSPMTIHFTNNSVNGLTYLWSFGDGGTSTAMNPSHTYTDSGTFTVKLYAYNNTPSPCGNLIDSVIRTAYISIDTPVHPTSIFTAEPQKGCSPLVINFNSNSKNYNSYYWSYGDGKIDSLFASLNPVHLYNSGSYTATLISYYLNNCKTAPDTMKVTIEVDSCNLYESNVFSPNGDGKNDFFNFSAEGYSQYHLLIFDRWGLKIFESSDTKIQWNGKVNNAGGDCADGTYYYIFSAIDINNQPYSNHGFLTLIR